MSEEKLYAVKNNVGKYLTIERTAPWWDSQVGTTVRNIDVALAWAGKHGGHVVTLVQEPKKVALSKKQAEIVKHAHDYPYPARYILDNAVYSSCVGEKLLMNAYVNGYTVGKKNKYNVKVPHVSLYYWQKPDGGLGTDDLNTDTDCFEFTESEIEHYGLQDCEKEEVTDDER